MESPFSHAPAGAFCTAEGLRTYIGVSERRFNGWLRGESDSGRKVVKLKAALRHFCDGDCTIVLSEWWNRFLETNADDITEAIREDKRTD